jgi:disulfide bond formation protein DsbB
VNGTLTWKLAALLIAVAAIGHEYAVKALAAGDPMYIAFYRVALVTIAAGAFVLVALPPRRTAYILGFVVCAGLLAYAFYLQYVELLEPCPLCFLQRLCVIVLGFVFLAAAVHDPGRIGAWVYALFAALAGGAGVALAARHVWIQNLPAGRTPACGMGIEYMLETLPFLEVLSKSLAGSGECAEKGWQFLNLALPGWTFVFFVAVAIVVAARNR